MPRAIAALPLLLAAAAHAQGFTPQYLIGSAHPLGGVTPYRASPPAVDGHTMVFNGQFGVYTMDLGSHALTTIAVQAQHAPPNPTTFPSGNYSSFYQDPRISSGRVTFGAFTTIGRTIVTNAGGPITSLLRRW